jgi:alpha-tubulin suppressor-like RCC1 family protein
LVAGLAHVAAIAAGGVHSCAVTRAGKTWCWGSNNAAQLGDGLSPDDGGRFFAPVPVPVSGPDEPITALAAGWVHTCGLSATGKVWCWGLRLSDLDEPKFAAVPMRIPGLPAPVMAISSGGVHMCALTSAGDIWCWARFNDRGEVGDGSVADRVGPVAVHGLPGPATAIAAGGHHTCALLPAREVWCWGDNVVGQLGTGQVDENPHPLPARVAGLPSDIASIAAGGGHTCAVTVVGAVWCWGNNWVGQLGNGRIDSLPQPVPQQVVGLPGPVSRVVGSEASGHPGFEAPLEFAGEEYAHNGHTCAILTDDRVLCWGANWFGQLGDGSFTRRPFPGDLFNPVAALLLPALAR